jgi:hypothetical protein
MKGMKPLSMDTTVQNSLIFFKAAPHNPARAICKQDFRNAAADDIVRCYLNT